jgi:hypothetical protein
MATDTIQRVHYFQRQFLGAEDFDAEQAYHRDMRRRHQLAHHTWGIVTGLGLRQQARQGDPAARDVFIEPGLAIDGFGREIVVLHPQPLDPQLFLAFGSVATLSVWITFADLETRRPADGYGDCSAATGASAGAGTAAGAGAFTRLSETFGILVEPKGDPNDPVTVDDRVAVPEGTTTLSPNPFVLPADGSAPYQAFPDDETRPRWRIKLGEVQWDGVARVFRDTPPDALVRDRRYAGVIAQDVLAPATTLRLAPREAFPDPRLAADFARVEGPLRVQGTTTAETHVFVDGGKVFLRGDHGSEDNVTLSVARAANEAAAGSDVRVRIGDPYQSGNPNSLARLAVGPQKSGKDQTVLAVRNDDSVELPTGKVMFRATKRQFVDVDSARYGMGYQETALYWRTDGDFYWYRGGVHDDGNGKPGAGGTALMQLDAGGTLHALGSAEVHKNLLVDGDARVSGVLRTDRQVVIAPNGDSYLRTRHIHGKDSGSDFDGPLYLNWGTGYSVVVGQNGGVPSLLEVNGDLVGRGNTSLAGTLSVAGTNNLFKMFQKTFALRNGGVDAPRSWTCPYAGVFREVYGAFVVMHGHSLWDHEGDTAFAPTGGHVASVDTIPQHVFVRLDSYDGSEARGVCYCSESKGALEGDNTVLFTVIVMGRPN